MIRWKPRQWPLTPGIAGWYASVDARPLASGRQSGIVGLRVTGSFASPDLEWGDLALVDLDDREPRPAHGKRWVQVVIARLPQRLAALAGFSGAATVARYCEARTEGCALYPFTGGRGQPVNASLIVPRADMASVILGTVIGTIDSCSASWSTWRQVEQRLTRGLAPKSPAHLTLEADSFTQLRDKVTAVARVYGSIDAPADLLDRSFPAKLLRPERQEYRAALRWARARGLKPRDLAAVGGGR